MTIKKKRKTILLILICIWTSGCGANNSTDDTAEAISLNQVGEYNGAPYVYLNNNIPYFTDEEKANTKPFENHVLYRVIPLFEGADLVAKGVEIEAWSMEDKGAEICFNVFCYNVQPGIEIGYATGESRIADNPSKQAGLIANDSEPGREETNNDAQTEEVRTYILNVNTKKFHLPTCSSVDCMSDKNKREVESTINEIKAQGYTPCSRCLGR